MCSRPVLTQPNFDKSFFLQTNASTYGVGAILLQEGEHHAVTSQKPKLHPIVTTLQGCLMTRFGEALERSSGMTLSRVDLSVV